MRYFIERAVKQKSEHSLRYACNHLMYNFCTLYLSDEIGIAVIQPFFNKGLKNIYWGPLDNDIADAIYESPNFALYFNRNAKKIDEHGLYPTVTVRQIMWALRMKPLPKQDWERYL